jgi:polar amino acid transport system substrate-binding protein
MIEAMQPALPTNTVQELAPTGTLRVGINLGNVVLAQGTPDAPRGVTVDLARELGKRLDTPVALATVDAARKSFEALKAGEVDVIFLAIEPARAAESEFTSPYVLSEGVYIVPQDSPLKSNADVAAAGVTVGVKKGSAYDLFLTRTLKHAEIVRGDEGIDIFVKEKLSAGAGVKQPVAAYAKAHPEVRLLEGRFMEIQQAMGVAKGRLAAARYLRSFIEEMKASGFVADALRRSGQADATIAPPE